MRPCWISLPGHLVYYVCLLCILIVLLCLLFVCWPIQFLHYPKHERVTGLKEQWGQTTCLFQTSKGISVRYWTCERIGSREIEQPHWCLLPSAQGHRTRTYLAQCQLKAEEKVKAAYGAIAPEKRYARFLESCQDSCFLEAWNSR